MSDQSTRDSNRALLSILSTASPPRPALPQELILQILSHPSRWVLAWSDNIVNPIKVDNIEGSRIILCTPPLTARSAKLLREVVFTICSHDQGWSHDSRYHGTFEASWTWFDAAVASNSTESVQIATVKMQNGEVSIPVSPNISRHRIQSNRHAVKAAAHYRISMYPGQEILDDLKVGDQILLVACAQYGAWVNYIEAAGIEIWEEDDLIE